MLVYDDMDLEILTGLNIKTCSLWTMVCGEEVKVTAWLSEMTAPLLHVLFILHLLN